MKAKIETPAGWKRLRPSETMDYRTDRMLWGTEGIWDTLDPRWFGVRVGKRIVIRKIKKARKQ